MLSYCIRQAGQEVALKNAICPFFLLLLLLLLRRFVFAITRKVELD